MSSHYPIHITLLSENIARGRGILAEHGLSYWIQSPSGNVLFDTGQGMVLRPNASTLGIDLSVADAIVLSHGHYDHSGSLESVRTLAPDATIFMHPAAVQRRYSGKKDGSMQAAYTPYLSEYDWSHAHTPCVWTTQPTEVSAGLFATGEVPRLIEYEDTGGVFSLDPEGNIPDNIPDDQALYFPSPEGTIVILGCAHAGVINTIEYILKLTDNAPIRAVLGGMHLLHATPERLQRTYAKFSAWDIPLLAPCHCTGVKAIAGFHHEFPQSIQEAHAGKTFVFDSK
ncbi:MBL fold metallo-hydrolase [Kiritimatiellota bacterium B12222]|nr:MBL fold metallo-hydrolase [Kiritimatiellota bacterium B12222]